jgi:hypothetical protein
MNRPILWPRERARAAVAALSPAPDARRWQGLVAVKLTATRGLLVGRLVRSTQLTGLLTNFANFFLRH